MGISLYRVFTLTHCAKGVLRLILPTPYSVIMVQECIDVASMLSGYCYVNDAMPISNLSILSTMSSTMYTLICKLFKELQLYMMA